MKKNEQGDHRKMNTNSFFKNEKCCTPLSMKDIKIKYIDFNFLPSDGQNFKKNLMIQKFLLHLSLQFYYHMNPTYIKRSSLHFYSKDWKQTVCSPVGGSLDTPWSTMQPLKRMRRSVYGCAENQL